MSRGSISRKLVTESSSSDIFFLTNGLEDLVAGCISDGGVDVVGVDFRHSTTGCFLSIEYVGA